MSDVGLQNTLAALILNTGVVPTTTLTAPASGTTATLADASHFSETCRLSFDDFLGEEPLAITSIAGNVCTLAFDGLGYSALKYTHLTNTRVYSNLKREPGIEVAPYLNKGDPFLAVTVEGYELKKTGFNKSGGTYHACIFYHRRLARPEGEQMPLDTYYDRQMAASRADFNTIKTALSTNQSLLVAGQSQRAIMLGELGQPGKPYIRTKWRDPAVKWDTDQFVFKLEVDITADWKPTG